MKKLLSVLLTIACVFTMTGTTLSAFAQKESETVILETDDGETAETPDEPENPDTPDEPDEPDIPDEPAPTLDDYEYVATMYLCSTAHSFTGHVWLYFVNLTECEIPIGKVMLKPGEGMSVGSISYFRKGGGGTYYNAEAKMACQKGLDKVCEHTNTLEMNLTMSQLEKVNEKITSLNFYSYIFWNCGCFATQVWNAVSDDFVVHIVLPVITVMNMRILGAQKGKLRMQETTEVFKQTKDGYEELGDHTFDSLCV